jgi:hypothetical protein
MKGCFRIFLFGLIGLILATPGFAGPSLCDAISGNMVLNCGFETGSFTDWTFAPSTDSFSAVDPAGDIPGLGPNSGTYYAALGTFNGDGSLGPTVGLATVLGQTYTFSFWLANTEQGTADSPNDFSADWGGTNVLAMNNAPAFSYTLYSFSETATSTTTTIGFTEKNDSGVWGLDDVSVVATDPASTPEPSSIVLMATGLAGMIFGRRAFRRQTK